MGRESGSVQLVASRSKILGIEGIRVTHHPDRSWLNDEASFYRTFLVGPGESPGCFITGTCHSTSTMGVSDIAYVMSYETSKFLGIRSSLLNKKGRGFCPRPYG